MLLVEAPGDGLNTSEASIVWLGKMICERVKSQVADSREFCWLFGALRR